jgi:CHAT domain-containing protein/Flp pilus assembly protein TadD
MKAPWHLICFLSLICPSIFAQEEASAPPDDPAAGVQRLVEQADGALEAGDFELALERAQALIRAAPEEWRGHHIRSVALAEGRKDYATAVEELQEVNRLAPDRADAWGNRGRYLILLGRFEEARPPTEKAQALDPASFAWTVNLGHTYLLLGERESTRAWYRKTIPLIPDEAALQAGPLADFDLFIARGWAPQTAREERAWVEQAWQEWQDVEALNTQVIELYRAGDYPGTIPLAEEGLEHAKRILGDAHPQVATPLNNLALLLDTTGRYAEAEPLYREALAIADQAGEPEILWIVQGNLSGLHAKQGHRPLAIFFGKQAVNTLQSVRQGLAEAEQATQQAFLKSKEVYYKDLADLLIAAGRLPEAQQVLRMLKEQEFYEFICRAPDTDVRQTLASFNPFEAEQLAAYAAESRQLVALASERETLLKLTESDPMALSAEQEARLAALEDELDTAKQRFYATLDRIKAAFAGLSEERRQALAERQLLQGKDDRGLVRDLAAQAGSRVALLHTLVLEDRVHLLLTLPEVLLAREAPVGEAALNGLVQQLRAALQDRRGDPLPAAQALYRTLITPIAADLSTAGIDTLMVSLDGTLRYLPLAALHDGEHYLIERYALSVFTELGRDNLKLPPKAQWRGIGLGVSLPHAEVGPTRASFSALPAVPAELEAIIRRPEPDDLDGILPGRYYLDADFTAAILRRALRAPVVHLASHFRGCIRTNLLIIIYLFPEMVSFNPRPASPYT